MKGTSVGVTVVHPGGVDTSIVRSARMHGVASAHGIEHARAAFQAALTLSPEIAAAIERIAPVSYWKLL